MQEIVLVLITACLFPTAKIVLDLNAENTQAMQELKQGGLKAWKGQLLRKLQRLLKSIVARLIAMPCVEIITL